MPDVFLIIGYGAAAGSDYFSAADDLTFLEGESSKEIRILIFSDATAENDECFYVKLSNPTGGATIGDEYATVVIQDNDRADIDLLADTATAAPVAEGASVSYEVSITGRQPTASVSFTATCDSQLLISGAFSKTLTFTTSNWNTPQTITVTVVDDFLAEGAHTGTITHSVSSSDSLYNYTPGGLFMIGSPALYVADLELDTADNDDPCVVVSETGGTTQVAEGGTNDTCSVVLGTQPAASVTVTVASDGEVLVNGAMTPTLTFTAANWSTPQALNISAVDDSASEGNHTSTVTFTVASSDSDYGGITVPALSVAVTDDDAPILAPVDYSSASPGPSLRSNRRAATA